MLPITRRDEYLYSVPKFDLGKSDIKDFMNELKGFHDQFADCFERSESREHFLKYMAGQFSPLERKSIEPIALAVEDGNVRALQRFVSDAPWNEEKMIIKYRSFVNDDLGSPDGALIFDESGFVKKGQTRSGSPNNTAVLSARSTIAKSAFSPVTYLNTAMRWLISGCSFQRSGSLSRILTVARNASFHRRRSSRPNPSWPLTCSTILAKKRSFPSSMCWPIRSMGSARSLSLRRSPWWTRPTWYRCLRYAMLA